MALNDTALALIPADGWYAHYEDHDRGVPLVAWAIVERPQHMPSTEVVGLIVPLHLDTNRWTAVVRADEEDEFRGFNRKALAFD
ncbi:MAG TPA: hypothetical protein VIM30_06720 [Candidatus Limnocylindrales bacterium]